ncbi:hypothetical protein ABZT06_02645 [Streptomyces sp. NPDC005483]|uniref:hypothetical protein n=1 Tax=Streptomyces sp. NPDC005483 TaxID=3154882 RepID=UPI0033B55F1A
MRVGITGHRGLPEDVAAKVRELLLKEAGSYDDLVGVSCLADGPDTWWAQAVLEAGGRLEVVVPAAGYRSALPDWHHPAYDSLVERADVVRHTGLSEPAPEAFQAGSELLVRVSDLLIAVWDGLPARGYGGTADAVDYAHQVDVPVRVLWPEGASRG